MDISGKSILILGGYGLVGQAIARRLLPESPRRLVLLSLRQEEAEEVVAVEYSGEDLEIGFNVSYLQDVLSVLTTDAVRIAVADGSSSAVIEAPEAEDSVFVVMPMRL